MKRPVPNSTIIALASIALIVLLGLTLAIYQIFKDNRINFDYATYWHSGQVLLLERGDPYSPAAAEQNQLLAYGRPARPGEDHLNFSYPVFFLITLGPLFFLPFDWSQAVWMAINLLAVISFALLFFTRLPKWIPLSLILFYEVYFNLFVGNAALLFGLVLIVLLDRLLFHEKPPRWADVCMGAALACIMGRPQLVWLLFLFIAFFCIRSRRWHVISGFAGMFLLQNALGFWLDPGWPVHWVRNTLAYSKEIGTPPIIVTYLATILPARWAAALYLPLLVIALGITAWLFRAWSKHALPALSLIAWCALATDLFDPSSLTPDRIILLAPVFLWALQKGNTRSVNLTWFLGLLISNGLFALSQARLIPGAIDRLPLVFYMIWLGYYWFGQARANRWQPSWKVAR